MAAGDYVIGVTDAFGCSAHDATVTVSEPDLLTVDADGCGLVYLGAGVDYACASINTIVAGGVPGYTFEWSNTETYRRESLFAQIQHLTIQLTVTDANGCTADAEWQVQVLDIACTPGGSFITALKWKWKRISEFSCSSGSGSSEVESASGSGSGSRPRSVAKYGKWT